MPVTGRRPSPPGRERNDEKDHKDQGQPASTPFPWFAEPVFEHLMRISLYRRRVPAFVYHHQQGDAQIWPSGDAGHERGERSKIVDESRSHPTFKVADLPAVLSKEPDGVVVLWVLGLGFEKDPLAYAARGNDRLAAGAVAVEIALAGDTSEEVAHGRYGSRRRW
jgi:hypothetical protein